MSSIRRIDLLNKHLLSNENNKNKILKDDNDIVIVSAVRTPIGKAKNGYFINETPDDLLQYVLEAIIKQTNIDPSLIDDITVGNVLLNGSGINEFRIGQLLTNKIPFQVPIRTINRQCASGLEAFTSTASNIKNGYYDIGIAIGLEMMSRNKDQVVPDINWKKTQNTGNKNVSDCFLSMGLTNENISKMNNISREKQDKFSYESHKKAFKATQMGYFKNEIIPLSIYSNIPILKDEGIREYTTIEKLNKLPSVFTEDGTTTPGNSSQVSDGAAALLLMTRRKANDLKLPILGKFIDYSVVGVPPSIMGIGPAIAIPRVLKKSKMNINDIEIFEINEAFASQVIYCIEELGIPMHKVNPNGGAIALGHPLGCTGARQIVTLLHELNRRKNDLNHKKGSYGIVSMCIGTGMGAAAIFYVD